MASNYIGEGECWNAVAGGTLTSGTPTDLGAGIVVVPETSAVSGDAVSYIARGQFRFPKIDAAIASSIHGAAETITQGMQMYWDATNGKATYKAVGPYLGPAALAAASGAAYVEVLVDVGTQLPGVRVVTAVLDQTLNSAIGTHALPGATIPAAYVVAGYAYRVITTFTSATDAATIALGVTTQDTDALKTAVAISNGANPWDAGAVGITAAAAPVFTSAERTLCAVVAVEALTAGKLVVQALCLPCGIAT